MEQLQAPTIKRGHGLLLASELVSVQPLGAPRGQLFYMDFGVSVPNRTKYYDRDEFYAYDEELRIYVGEELYPKYLKKHEQKS